MHIAARDARCLDAKSGVVVHERVAESLAHPVTTVLLSSITIECVRACVRSGELVNNHLGRAPL